MNTHILEQIRKVRADEKAGKVRLRDALFSAIQEIDRCHHELRATKTLTDALNSYIDRRIEDALLQESPYAD